MNKRTCDKERILRYLLRKGDIQNTYKIARELGMERFEVLDILQELTKEGNVRLRSGSVKAITPELKVEDKIKTKSEIEELKERIERLEKVIEFAFREMKGAIDTGHKRILRKGQLMEDQDGV